METIDMLSDTTKAAALKELAEKVKELEVKNALFQTEIAIKNKQLELIATQGLDIRKIHSVSEIEQYMGFEGGYLQNLLESNEAEYLKSIFNKYNTLIDAKTQAMKDKQIDVNGDTVSSKLKDAVEFFRGHPSVETFTAESTVEYAQTVTKLSNALELLWAWKGASADLQNFNEAVAHGIMQYAIKKIAGENQKQLNKSRVLAIDPEKELEERQVKQKEEKEKEKQLVEDEDKLNKISANLEALTAIVQKMTAEKVEETVPAEEPEIDSAPEEPVVKRGRR